MIRTPPELPKAGRSGNRWHPPAIRFELPFGQTQAGAGCANDNAAQTPNAFTPVLKVGSAADTEVAACLGSS
jgi:hypothetical protein